MAVADGRTTLQIPCPVRGCSERFLWDVVVSMTREARQAQVQIVDEKGLMDVVKQHIVEGHRGEIVKQLLSNEEPDAGSQAAEGA
jgi:hypothetical protein